MSAGEDRKRVHFRGPSDLIERADSLAAILDRDRTDLIVEALREYLDDAATDDAVRRRLATAYYEDDLDFDALVALVGLEAATRFRLLKRDLDDEPVEIPEPDSESGVYDEAQTRSVDPRESGESGE